MALMSEASKFRIALEELERNACTKRAERVESVAPKPEQPEPDPRGQLPDRDWFASGA
jgi:hypothetical protein